ncbi:hypothetical protein C8J56DRAFT_974438 [Mycena floridula]|nr:hypothetical protein C8J56DRAFT_974438 [Mycena floridula]
MAGGKYESCKSVPASPFTTNMSYVVGICMESASVGSLISLALLPLTSTSSSEVAVHIHAESVIHKDAPGSDFSAALTATFERLCSGIFAGRGHPKASVMIVLQETTRTTAYIIRKAGLEAGLGDVGPRGLTTSALSLPYPDIPRQDGSSWNEIWLSFTRDQAIAQLLSVDVKFGGHRWCSRAADPTSTGGTTVTSDIPDILRVLVNPLLEQWVETEGRDSHIHRIFITDITGVLATTVIAHLETQFSDAVISVTPPIAQVAAVAALKKHHTVERINEIANPIVPLNIGIRRTDGTLAVAMPSHRHAPTIYSILLTTSQEGQTTATLNLILSDSPYAVDGIPLGTIKIAGLQTRPKGQARIRVSIDVKVNDAGMLVKIEEILSGQDDEVIVGVSTQAKFNSSHGDISHDEIDLLRMGFENPDGDDDGIFERILQMREQWIRDAELLRTPWNALGLEGDLSE